MSSYLIPNVIESTPRGERVSDLYSRLLAERIVLVGTEIDDGVANVVVAQLLHLAAADPDREISLYLHSPGGSFGAVLAIYDTMQFVRPDVATLGIGQVAGTAALLLAGGTAGTRAVLEHARVVLHQPQAPTSRGSLTDLAHEAAELAAIHTESDALLARHTGRTAAQIRLDTDRAMVLRADAAVAYGLVDRVLRPASSGGEQLEAQAALHPGHPGASLGATPEAGRDLVEDVGQRQVEGIGDRSE